MNVLVLGSKRIPFLDLPGTNFKCSVPLLDQVGPWIELLKLFPIMSQDIWIVSSIVTSMDGSPRNGSSHDLLGALDIAPINEWNFPTKSNGSSPLLFNNRLFVERLVALSPTIPIGIYVEQDHLHLGFNNPPGVYLYKDYSKYRIDASLKESDDFGNTIKILPDGSRSPYKVGRGHDPFYATHPISDSIIKYHKHEQSSKSRK